ncbi:MAG: hypothetical protein ACPKPY_12815, partial [Nitrososphaeraceae archaeon]
MLFTHIRWKREFGIYLVISIIIFEIFAIFVTPAYLTLIVYYLSIFFIMWKVHENITKNKENSEDHLFGSKNWWKELIVIELIYLVIGFGWYGLFDTAYFISDPESSIFPYSEFLPSYLDNFYTILEDPFWTVIDYVLVLPLLFAVV